MLSLIANIITLINTLSATGQGVSPWLQKLASILEAALDEERRAAELSRLQADISAELDKWGLSDG